MSHFQAESGTGKALPQFAPEILFLGPSDKELGMTHKCTPPCLGAGWHLKQQAVCPAVSEAGTVLGGTGRHWWPRQPSGSLLTGPLHSRPPSSASCPGNPALARQTLTRVFAAGETPQTLGSFFWFLGWCPLFPWHFSYGLYYDSAGDPCPPPGSLLTWPSSWCWWTVEFRIAYRNPRLASV